MTGDDTGLLLLSCVRQPTARGQVPIECLIKLGITTADVSYQLKVQSMQRSVEVKGLDKSQNTASYLQTLQIDAMLKRLTLLVAACDRHTAISRLPRLRNSVSGRLSALSSSCSLTHVQVAGCSCVLRTAVTRLLSFCP